MNILTVTSASQERLESYTEKDINIADTVVNNEAAQDNIGVGQERRATFDAQSSDLMVNMMRLSTPLQRWEIA